jgi:hypothetical protein
VYCSHLWHPAAKWHCLFIAEQWWLEGGNSWHVQQQALVLAPLLLHDQCASAEIRLTEPCVSAAWGGGRSTAAAAAAAQQC